MYVFAIAIAIVLCEYFYHVLICNLTFEGGGDGMEPTDNWSKVRPVCGTETKIEI